jgi:hypothetical protein
VSKRDCPTQLASAYSSAVFSTSFVKRFLRTRVSDWGFFFFLSPSSSSPEPSTSTPFITSISRSSFESLRPVIFSYSLPTTFYRTNIQTRIKSCEFNALAMPLHRSRYCFLSDCTLEIYQYRIELRPLVAWRPYLFAFLKQVSKSCFTSSKLWYSKLSSFDLISSRQRGLFMKV